MTIRHLNQLELSRRWNMSPRTLERWRSIRVGPPYLKIRGGVVYRLEDIERYEAEQRRNDHTHPQPVQAGGIPNTTLRQQESRA